MNILRNPFHILGVSLYDTKERILEAVEEKSLLVDNEEEFARCCAELINPKKRLRSEIAWFVVEEEINRIALLETVQREPEKAIFVIEGLKPCERFTVLLSALSAKSSTLSKDLSTWILRIALEYEMIDVEELVENIGDNRLASGFPVVDRRMVEEALLEQRNWCREVLKNVLDTLPPRELIQIVTTTVDQATNYGKEHAPGIIDDLVEAYEVEAQAFFTTETESIERLTNLLQEYADANKPEDVLSFITESLIKMVENWDTVAQPIQVSAQSRGILHQPSKQLADLVRSTSIYLFNKHGKLDLVQRLNNMLQKVFAEILPVVEMLKEDEKTLRQNEERNKEITYEAEIGGSFLKNTFRISPKGIEWKGKRWDLEQITRIRWGGITTTTTTRGSFISNTRTESSYSIYWGTEREIACLTTENDSLHRKLVDLVWKAIGVRLYIEMLEALREEKTFNFGSVTLFDSGVSLYSNSFIYGTQRVSCDWNDLSIWSHNGAFCISKKGDKALESRLPYLEIDNVHILETALRSLLKTSNSKMSSLL